MRFTSSLLLATAITYVAASGNKGHQEEGLLRQRQADRRSGGAWSRRSSDKHPRDWSFEGISSLIQDASFATATVVADGYNGLPSSAPLPLATSLGQNGSYALSSSILDSRSATATSHVQESNGLSSSGIDGYWPTATVVGQDVVSSLVASPIATSFAGHVNYGCSSFVSPPIVTSVVQGGNYEISSSILDVPSATATFAAQGGGEVGSSSFREGTSTAFVVVPTSVVVVAQ